MPTGSRITPAQIAHYWSLRAQGFSIRRATQEAGFSLDSGKALERKKKLAAGSSGRNVAEARTALFRNDQAISDFPLNPELWSDATQEAMADRTGALFAKRFTNIDLAPWQRTMWETLEDRYDTGDREYVCVNAPPGLGKSTVLVLLAAKLTARDRAIRGLFMSRAYSLAERNTLRLRRILERTVPFVDCETTMAREFGRFKCGAGELWRRDGFVVEQFDGAPVEEKEPTWAAFGFDAEWLGNRLDVLFGDDLDSSRSVRNMQTVESNRDIFDNELEPRIEGGGLMVLAQQRLGPFDFSAHALAKRNLPDDDGSGDEVEGEPKYEHVVFKAHYEDRCRGKATHRYDSLPYPDGCLLDPRQLPYRDLRRVMTNRSAFELVYQQNDMVTETGLVKQVWLDGGPDRDGHIYPGCWDERNTWELPGTVGGFGNGLDGETIGVITVDPSPTAYWCIQAWAVHRSTNQRFLLDVVREKMDAPEFLDWSSSLNTFTGIAEDWTHNFAKVGVDLSWVIVEINAAQRFMLQYDHFHRWMRQRGVQVIGHSTQRNKADATFGVQMLAPLYAQGLIRLPGAHHIRGVRTHSVMRLVNELLRYPNSTTTDCVMAHWFLEYNIDKLYSAVPEGLAPRWTPSWLAPSA